MEFREKREDQHWINKTEIKKNLKVTERVMRKIQDDFLIFLM